MGMPYGAWDHREAHSTIYLKAANTPDFKVSKKNGNNYSVPTTINIKMFKSPQTDLVRMLWGVESCACPIRDTSYISLRFQVLCESSSEF